MAHARLYVICGNCGSDAYLRYRIDPDGSNHVDGTTTDAVHLLCGNCGTLHNLMDNAKPMEKETP